MIVLDDHLDETERSLGALRSLRDEGVAVAEVLAPHLERMSGKRLAAQRESAAIRPVADRPASPGLDFYRPVSDQPAAFAAALLAIDATFARTLGPIDIDWRVQALTALGVEGFQIDSAYQDFFGKPLP